MAGHVFVSYSRADRAYVEALAAHLDAAGVSCWYDHRIVVGDRFDQVIAEQIDTCVAFVVVMTPASYASNWVANEIKYAQDHGKRIVPLLLAGEPFISLTSLDYEDVRGGSMLGPAGVAALRALLGSPPSRTQTFGGLARVPMWARLGADERALVNVRPVARATRVVIVALTVIGLAGAAVTALLVRSGQGGELQTWFAFALALAGISGALMLASAPNDYLVTERRLLVRRLGNVQGIRLRDIGSVDYRQLPIQQRYDCATIRVRLRGGRSHGRTIKLSNVPDAAEVARTLQLLATDSQAAQT
jgi:TIR domain/Bacterial PH domain